MDSSPWDPPIYEDDSSGFGGNWQSDFYFDLGRDVIEEDAINERCCVQVLNILIPKADAEIEELEQEIILLKGELAWANEDWSNICSATLTERINSLDISIQRLKNGEVQQEQGLDSSVQSHGHPAQNENQQTENELDFCFQTHGDPAQNEKLPTEHGDPAQNEKLPTEDELDFWFETLGDPVQNQKLQTEREMDFCFQTHGAPAQNEKLQTENELDFRFQTHGDPAQNQKQQTAHEMDIPYHKHGEPAPKLSEIIKVLLDKYPNRDEQNSSSNAEKLATCQSKDETKLSNFEAIACVAKSSEETAEPFYLEAPKRDLKEKDQSGDTTITDSITNFSEHASEASTKRKMIEINSSIEIGQGTEIHGSTSKAEKRMYKEAAAVMINSSANALRCEAGSICGKGGCNCSKETCGGATEQSLKIESANMKPSPKPEETIISEADMNSSSNAEKLATCQSEDETKLSNFEAIACIAKSSEETGEPFYLEPPKRDVKEDQNGDTAIIDSITNFSEPASEASTKRKMIEIYSSTQTGQGTGIHGSTSKAEKRMYTTNIEKVATAVMINTSANALRFEAGSNSGKGVCNLSVETCGGISVQSNKIESTNLVPSSKPKETTITEADMHADMASVCMLDQVKQIAKEPSSMQKLKMVADADRTNKIDTPQQLLRTERMTTEFPPRMKQDWLSDSERTIGKPFLELLNNKGKEARKPLIKEGQKPQLLKQMQNIEVVGTEPSMSKFMMKSWSPNLSENPFPILESGIVPEPSFAMEKDLKISSMKNIKRNLLPRILDEKRFVNKKIKEETHLDFSGEKSFRRCMHEVKMNAYVKDADEPISNLHAAKDAGVKPLKLLSCTASVATLDLKYLPMAQLRAMAKERKLTKYSKLNKSDLIKLLEQ